MKRPTESTLRERGSAIVFCLIFLMLVFALAMALASITHTRGKAVGETVWLSESTYAAEAAIEHAYSVLWDDYLVWTGGNPGPINEYRTFLEDDSDLGLTDGGVIDVSSSLPDLGMEVTALMVRRTDDGIATDLTIEATLGRDGLTNVYSHILRTSGEPFSGLDFGLLTNNVNCIFCHAKVDSVAKFSSENYERVKVATMETLATESIWAWR